MGLLPQLLRDLRLADAQQNVTAGIWGSLNVRARIRTFPRGAQPLTNGLIILGFGAVTTTKSAPPIFCKASAVSSLLPSM